MKCSECDPFRTFIAQRAEGAPVRGGRSQVSQAKAWPIEPALFMLFVLPVPTLGRRRWGRAGQQWPKKCQYENPPLAALAKVARPSDGFCHYNRTLPQKRMILESLIWHALHHAFLAEQIVEKRWITLPDWARSPCSNVAVFAAHVERNASSYRRK